MNVPHDQKAGWIEAVARQVAEALGWELRSAWAEAEREAAGWDFGPQALQTPPAPQITAAFIINQFRQPPSLRIKPPVLSDIMARLQGLQQSHEIKILFAIESGSRAWGFPSPDSDYDVRFVYARPMDWYLSVQPGRDVIELPIEGDLDINGWDLQKALFLLLKPNPVLLEWLSSPIRYIWQREACEKLLELAGKTTHGLACLHHYRHLGERQWQTYIDGKDAVDLKKYFYAVRPAMAIRWLRLRPGEVPPMNFAALQKAIEMPPAVTTDLQKLLELKAQTKEMGQAGRLTAVDDFILSEFQWAAEMAAEMAATDAAQKPGPRRPDLKRQADTLFRQLVKQ